MNRNDEYPLYSICITHFNNVKSLSQSLESILQQIDERFEVIVVDSLSSDGSLEKLRTYADAGKIELFTEKCTRGSGRQLAFDHSRGRYILSNFDMDDVFCRSITKILELYHSNFEGMMIRITSPRKFGRWTGYFANTIAPKELLQRLGGWANVQFGEDIDLWSRAATQNKYGWMEFDLIESTFDHEESGSFWKRLRTKWEIYRDFQRLGLTINAGTLPSKLLKIISTARYRTKGEPGQFKRDFSSVNSSYYHLSERYCVKERAQNIEIDKSS